MAQIAQMPEKHAVGAIFADRQQVAHIAQMLPAATSCSISAGRPQIAQLPMNQTSYDPCAERPQKCT